MSNLLLSKIGHVISEFPLAFKQTKEVKLFMTLLVKNEEGMLEENLQFHKAMGVDGFIITDNNSTDSTPDIIRKYKQKGWIKEVIEEKATNYEQKDWVDRMIWKAKTIYKADWIINADADELWYAPTGNLKDELYATNANVLNCEMRSVYPEEEKPFWQWDKTVKAVTEPEKYDLSLYSLFERQNKKVIHRTAGYLQISMGNHKVTMFPQNSADSHIHVYHYNIRGKQQFMEKMIITALIRNLILAVQKISHYRRKQTFEFKKGGNWISITENAVKYLLQYKEIVLNRMKYTLCADEIFIQTILWNSPFRERMHCTNNANTGSMREIDWEHGSPYIWQDHDYQTLINSNKIFARKFNSNQMGIVYKIQKLYLKQVPK